MYKQQLCIKYIIIIKYKLLWLWNKKLWNINEKLYYMITIFFNKFYKYI